MSAYLAVVAAVLLVGLASVLAAHPALPPPPPRALLSHQAPTPAGAALGAALGVFQEAGLAGPGAVQRAFQPEAGGRLVAAAKVSGVHGLAALTKMQQEQLKWQVGVALGHWRWVQEGSRSSFSAVHKGVKGGKEVGVLALSVVTAVAAAVAAAVDVKQQVVELVTQRAFPTNETESRLDTATEGRNNSSSSSSSSSQPASPLEPRVDDNSSGFRDSGSRF
eukprot:CAMPEP_0171631710 /NCGR_PEP_ID=MMETSP0990-20121206/23851_1 /TAXON_ID=483369 /ORGANISM="non described non described, Strain CCMP2098" /LENGTH=220 /DNA_ID=CAMNT_0012201451 /DNA_START=151 /DNA_END=812 /DNA_ORIENTATION=-